MEQRKREPTSTNGWKLAGWSSLCSSLILASLSLLSHLKYPFGLQCPTSACAALASGPNVAALLGLLGLFARHAYIPCSHSITRTYIHCFLDSLDNTQNCNCGCVAVGGVAGATTDGNQGLNAFWWEQQTLVLRGVCVLKCSTSWKGSGRIGVRVGEWLECLGAWYSW